MDYQTTGQSYRRPVVQPYFDWILFAAYLSKIWQRFLKTNVDKMYYKNFTHFLMSKYVFSRGFLFKILALCMVNIQEWFQIKSRIWWYAYIIYLVSLNFKLITKHFRICAKKFSALLKAQVVPETSFYSVLIVEIPKWSWILLQIATKINILTFDFLSLEYKLPFGCQKTLAGIFSSNLGCFNNLLRPNYSNQWPQ